MRNERNMVKSRLSCLPMAEKVGDEFLLNDAENGAIVDAPLPREKYSIIVSGKNGGLLQLLHTIIYGVQYIHVHTVLPCSTKLLSLYNQ